MRPSGTKRGKVTAARVFGGRTLLDVELLSGEQCSYVELLAPTGWTMVPAPGADVLVQEVGGDRGHLVATVADDASLRIDGLGPGDFGLRDARGQQVTMTAEGVRVKNALQVIVEATDEIVLACMVVRLGSAGASIPVRLANNAAASKVFAE